MRPRKRVFVVGREATAVQQYRWLLDVWELRAVDEFDGPEAVLVVHPVVWRIPELVQMYAPLPVVCLLRDAKEETAVLALAAQWQHRPFATTFSRLVLRERLKHALARKRGPKRAAVKLMERAA